MIRVLLCPCLARRSSHRRRLLLHLRPARERVHVLVGENVDSVGVAAGALGRHATSVCNAAGLVLEACDGGGYVLHEGGLLLHFLLERRPLCFVAGVTAAQQHLKVVRHSWLFVCGLRVLLLSVYLHIRNHAVEEREGIVVLPKKRLFSRRQQRRLNACSRCHCVCGCEWFRD